MAPDDSSLLLELYKTAVEMADRVSARRGSANTFFVTLNTALAAVVGIVSAAKKPSRGGSSPSFDAFGLVVASVAGIVLAIVWWALLRYYRRLSRAKWDVINELERHFPVAPFTDEWARLHPEGHAAAQVVRGSLWARIRVRSTHREATVVEQVVPFVFVALYLALGIRVIVS